MNRQQVVDWLKNGGDFHEGLALLPSEGYLGHFHHACSVQGPTKSNRQMLEYQLCKLVGISEREAKKLFSIPPVSIAPPAVVPIQVTLTVDQVPIDNPDKVIERTKLREDYPFLGDRSCPDELKILVADKFTTYYAFINAHEKLFNCVDPTSCYEVANEVVINYLENRQIHLELEHYKKHGKVLGKHRLFFQVKRLEDIRTMKAAELVKHKSKMEMNIWRNKSQIAKEPDSENNLLRRERIAQYEIELREVNRILELK